MKTRLFGVVALLAMLIAASVAVATASAQSTKASASSATPAIQISTDIKQFFTKNGKLHARGFVVATVTTDTGTHTARQPFQAALHGKTTDALTTATTPTGAALPTLPPGSCTILNLTIAPIHLELLGLIVDTSQIQLRIAADPNGGLLGQLLCGNPPLVTPTGAVKATPHQAAVLTQAAQTSGLATGAATTSSALLPPVPAGVCTVLDLVLGPIHLDLLGLIVDTNRIEVRITADPNGGLLGQLLCGNPPLAAPNG